MLSRMLALRKSRKRKERRRTRTNLHKTKVTCLKILRMNFRQLVAHQHTCNDACSVNKGLCRFYPLHGSITCHRHLKHSLLKVRPSTFGVRQYLMNLQPTPNPCNTVYRRKPSRYPKPSQGRALTQQPPCWDTEPAAVKAEPRKVYSRHLSLTQRPRPVAVKDGPRCQVPFMMMMNIMMKTFPSMSRLFSPLTLCRRSHLSFQCHTARGHALLCATHRNPLIFMTMLTMCWLPCLRSGQGP